jgi:hypothetical protein
MPKKIKRQTRKVSAAETRSSSSGASLTSSSGLFEREFNPDYSQTIKDLKRIGVLAGSFFMVLIVLSFFLR